MFFPREHSLIPSCDKWQRPRSWKGTADHKPYCRHGVPLLLWGQVRWIHLPGDFQRQVMFLQSNSSFLVTIWRRNQEWAAPPVILLGCNPQWWICILCPQIPAFLQIPMNQVLPASQKHPEFPSHSFLQHTGGVLLKCNSCIPFNEYIPFSNWLSLTWEIESSAEDSFPERDFFPPFFKNNLN